MRSLENCQSLFTIDILHSRIRCWSREKSFSGHFLKKVTFRFECVYTKCTFPNDIGERNEIDTI